MKNQEVAELVANYRNAAYLHGHTKKIRKANAAADTVAAIYRELRKRDLRSSLLPLLMDSDDSVRGWAAAHALEFAPEKGLPVLIALANGPFGALRADASITIDVWRAGELRFP